MAKQSSETQKGDPQRDSEQTLESNRFSVFSITSSDLIVLDDNHTQYGKSRRSTMPSAPSQLELSRSLLDDENPPENVTPFTIPRKPVPANTQASIAVWLEELRRSGRGIPPPEAPSFARQEDTNGLESEFQSFLDDGGDSPRIAQSSFQLEATHSLYGDEHAPFPKDEQERWHGSNVGLLNTLAPRPQEICYVKATIEDGQVDTPIHAPDLKDGRSLQSRSPTNDKRKIEPSTRSIEGKRPSRYRNSTARSSLPPRPTAESDYKSKSEARPLNRLTKVKTAPSTHANQASLREKATVASVKSEGGDGGDRYEQAVLARRSTDTPKTVTIAQSKRLTSTTSSPTLSKAPTTLFRPLAEAPVQVFAGIKTSNRYSNKLTDPTTFPAKDSTAKSRRLTSAASTPALDRGPASHSRPQTSLQKSTVANITTTQTNKPTTSRVFSPAEKKQLEQIIQPYQLQARDSLPAPTAPFSILPDRRSSGFYAQRQNRPNFEELSLAASLRYSSSSSSEGKEQRYLDPAVAGRLGLAPPLSPLPMPSLRFARGKVRAGGVADGSGAGGSTGGAVDARDNGIGGSRRAVNSIVTHGVGTKGDGTHEVGGKKKRKSRRGRKTRKFKRLMRRVWRKMSCVGG
ncbi:hypothetical protein K402DRAFT_452257 [Aulographum hederae CBS 113979]|uniref:Uncharacterized protein n=1 Tax=Aulographum hederae CBS 113979 TaxID=1176131 RepID=A0A6G1H6W4_9PEZI|nr:hypothetical protein K402DRAFT_452257 [Aulographum hederae CBS 113979]